MILSNEIEFSDQVSKKSYFSYIQPVLEQNLYNPCGRSDSAEAKSDLYCPRLTPSFVLNYIQKCQKSVQRQTTLLPLIYAPQHKCISLSH